MSWMTILLLTGIPSPASADNSAESYPELGEVRDMVRMKRPDGVAFLVMDHDIEAYSWVLPRLEHYLRIIRDKWPDMPIAVISHGDEIFSLLWDKEEKYKEFHDKIRTLVMEDGIAFQVCGAFAALSGVDASEFADFVDVVPSAPTQISDYRFMGYKVIHLDPTW